MSPLLIARPVYWKDVSQQQHSIVCHPLPLHVGLMHVLHSIVSEDAGSDKEERIVFVVLECIVSTCLGHINLLVLDTMCPRHVLDTQDLLESEALHEAGWSGVMPPKESSLQPLI